MDIISMRKKLDAGGVIIGTCVTECKNRQIGRIFANFGFDFLIIECEHSSYNLETIADMIAISKLSGIVPIVKIGEYSYATFSRYLDAGAEGFIFPRIRERKEVEKVMEWIKYYPEGIRGYSPSAPYCNYGFDIKDKYDHREFINQKNKNLFIVIQFETKDAIESVDDILSVPGIAAVVMGPCDLSMSLGMAGDLENPILKNAVKKVFDSCKKYNIKIGNALGNIEEVKKQIKEGLQFIWWKNDYAFLQSSQKEVEEIKKLLEERINYNQTEVTTVDREL